MQEMQKIFRTDHKGKFTMVDNQMIDDKSLSFEAKGMLLHLLHLPDNWNVCIADLVNRGNAGKDKVYRILNELIDAKYVIKNVIRDKSGKILRNEYSIYEIPYKHAIPITEPVFNIRDTDWFKMINKDNIN